MQVSKRQRTDAKTGRWKRVPESAGGVSGGVQGDGSRHHDQHLLPRADVVHASGTKGLEWVKIRVGGVRYRGFE